MYNINLKSYVKAELGELAEANHINLKGLNLDKVTDSVLFDWNEIGDPSANIHEVIEYNLETYFSGSHA